MSKNVFKLNLSVSVRSQRLKRGSQTWPDPCDSRASSADVPRSPGLTLKELCVHVCMYSHAVVSVDRLKKMNFAGARLPRYQSLRGPRPADLETAVTLPDSVFQPPVDTRGHRHLDVFPESSARNGSANRMRRHPDDNQQDAIASVIIFYSLASLLPESYDPDKRSLR